MRLTLPDSVRFHILWNGLRGALDGAESGAIWSRLSIALDSYSEKTEEFTEEGGIFANLPLRCLPTVKSRFRSPKRGRNRGRLGVFSARQWMT